MKRLGVGGSRGTNSDSDKGQSTHKQATIKYVYVDIYRKERWETVICLPSYENRTSDQGRVKSGYNTESLVKYNRVYPYGTMFVRVCLLFEISADDIT